MTQKSVKNRNRTFYIFGTSLIAINLFQIYTRLFYSEELVGSFLFQEFSTNLLMQTLEFNYLVENKIKSLLYLHIQPPLLEVFRLLISSVGFPFAKIFYKQIDDQILFIDLSLYFFYSIIYSLMNAMMYRLLIKKSESITLSIFGTMAWALYPPNLYISTLLDNTYFSMFLFFLIIYVFVMSRNKVTQLTCFIFIFLTLNLTRSIFPFAITLLIIIYIIYHLYQTRIYKRKILLYFILSLSLLLPFKQYILFGTFATSSFTGEQLIQSAWYYPTESEIKSISLPKRLISNSIKLENKFNTHDQIILHFQLEKIFYKKVFSSPQTIIKGYSKSLGESIKQLFVPTTQYSNNTLTNVYPLTKYYESKLSSFIYAFLFLLSSIIIFTKQINFLFPEKVFKVLFQFIYLNLIFSLLIGSNRYEWTELERLRFILDPWIFIVSFCVFLSSSKLILVRIKILLKYSKNFQVSMHNKENIS